MVFDGYSDPGCSSGTPGWFPGTRNVIYNISKNLYFSKNYQLSFSQEKYQENFLSYLARNRWDFGAKPVFRGISMVVMVFYRKTIKTRFELCLKFLITVMTKRTT